ncbi:hypothetical protein [Cellulophaga sp. Z1A5H]|uniref:hypothetical protein n=1 Tax=Cellulophaga sp. Z1A5H TaxID=2687291 RepID=UPI0013FE4849|nr:hypothetical protein [Cellulophaga sp. Z1A5H]
MCSSCNAPTTDKNITIALKASEYPVVLRYSQEQNKFWRIDIPLKATLTNKYFLRKTLVSVNFNHDKKKAYKKNIHNRNNTSVRIYSGIQQPLERISERNYLYYEEPKELTLYAHTFLDTTKVNKALFSSYLKTITSSSTHLDRLVIGSVTNLKHTHPELVAYLNQGELYFEFEKNNTMQTDDIPKNIAF